MKSYILLHTMPTVPHGHFGVWAVFCRLSNLTDMTLLVIAHSAGSLLLLYGQSVIDSSLICADGNNTGKQMNNCTRSPYC